MNRKSNILFRLMIGVIVVGLLGLNLLAVAQASPPAQDPRPPIDNGGSGGGGGGGGGGNGGDGGGNTAAEAGPIEPGCAAATGQVINWGLGPQGDINVELKGGGWRTAARSASDGNYALGGLGVGVAKLHVNLAPAEQSQLLIQDAGVYLNCKYPTIANIAMYNGPRVDPPAKIDMTAPGELITPAGNFEVTLTVQNSLPTDISNVIVTDLMPQGLKALKVDSSIDPKNAQIVSDGEKGQLVALYWDKLASKAKVTIRLTLNADVDLLNGTKIRNTATLFYKESAADQAWLDFTVGTNETPILASSGAASNTGAEFVPPANAPTTGGSLLETKPVSAEPAAAGRVTASTADTAAGEAVVPPGNMPSTGGEIDLPANTLNLEDQVNLAEAELVVGREVKPAEEPVASVYGLTVNTDNSGQSEMLGLHEVAARGPSVMVAAAVLFLGLLVLGSGITLWRRRFDS